MSEIAVNCLLGKLKDLLENGVLLRGAEEEVALVKRQLEYVRAFLRVADSLEERDEEVRVWVKQLREIAYDTEDALDEFKLLLLHDHGIGFPGLLSKMSCCIKNMKDRYRISPEMKSINSRIKNIYDGQWRIRDKLNKVELHYVSSKPDDTWQDRKGNALLLDKAELVGISEPTKKLVGWLIEGTSTRQVISVVGMGGLGKTTLVKQVYEDPEVKKHFMVRAWITLSQSPNIEELLQGMVRQIMGNTQEPFSPLEDNMDRLCHKMIIKDLLEKAGYLIVVDDAWRINEWDGIKHALPNNTCGGQIIITSRNADLAYTSCGEFRGMAYKMEPLPAAQSWKLFCTKTFHGKSCPPHLEETCRLILRKCEGLPLAIVAICGVLVSKNTRNKAEWDLVRRSLRTEIDCNDKFKALKRILSLSFDDLPYYLKSCFLHLSVFPEGYIINCARLIQLWIAEGFVDKKQGLTLEVAQGYLNKLLNRSLIEVAVKTSDGRIHYCRIHDFLLDIIISKSSNQGFAETAKDKHHKWLNKVCRLSIQNSLQAIQ